jgi:type II secretory pathway pseudopilin PulG
VALAGVALAATGVIWSTERQREREKELLFIGTQFRNAIASYYERSPGLVKRYPTKLQDLLKDGRYLTVQRHLTQIYLDPMTATREWGLIPAPEGGIMGIYSTSSAAPIKRSGFTSTYSDFEGKTSYAEWRFIYRPTIKTGTSPLNP